MAHVSRASTARLWHFPALVAVTILPASKCGLDPVDQPEVDDRGSIAALETEAWQQRPEQLGRLGGPPKADSGSLLDPILYGRPDPTARAEGFGSSGRSRADAEAAFGEVVDARPLYAAAWSERGRFHVLRLGPGESRHRLRPGSASKGPRSEELLADVVASDKVLN